MYPDGIRPNRLAIPPQSEPETVPNRVPSVPGDAPAPVQASSPTAVDLAGRGYHQAQDNLDVFNRTFSSQEVRNDPVLLEMRAGYEQSVKQARAGLKQAIETEIKAGYQREFDARPTGAVYDRSAIDSHGQAIAGRYNGDPQTKADVEAIVAEIRLEFEVNSTLDTARAMGDPRKALDYLRSETPKLSPEAQKSLAGNDEVLGWKRELGNADGKAVASAWDDFKATQPGALDYEAKREALHAALENLRANGADPAYAEAALKGLGAAKLNEFVGGFYRIDSGNPNIAPRDFDVLKGYFGPLAQVVATADHAGVLPADTKKALFECGPAQLALFLRSAPQTEGMMRDAMQMLLDGPGYTPAGNFAIQQLMVGMDQHPRLMQELLADPKSSGLLFSASMFAPSTGTDYEQDFARALNVALTPGQGDPATQQKAWTALIRACMEKEKDFAAKLMDPFDQGESFRSTIDAHPLLAQAMAEQFKYYLPWAANKQAQVDSDDFQIPPLPQSAPRLDNTLTLDELTNFMAALCSDPKAMKSLVDETMRLLSQGGLAGMTPELVRSNNRLPLQSSLQTDFALFALVLAGITRADLDEQVRRDQTAEALKTIVMGYALAVIPPGAAPLVDGALSPWSTVIFKKLADDLQRATGGEQIKGDDILKEIVNVIEAAVKLKVQELAPELNAAGVANDIARQFESTSLREMLQEFWKAKNS